MTVQATELFILPKPGLSHNVKEGHSSVFGRVQRSPFRFSFFFWREVSNVNTMASRRPLSARNVDHTQGRGKPKKERYPFALLDRATLVQNLRHLTKDSSFPVNVCEDDLLKPTVSVVTLIIICSHGVFSSLPGNTL